MIRLQSLVYRIRLTCKADGKNLHLDWSWIILVVLFLVVKMFNFATWIVRGLSKDHKRSLLDQDCLSYKMDIVCLQETKCTVHEDLLLQNKSRLIIMDQKHSRRGGLGFVIGSRMQDFIKSYGYISDRVAILDLQIPTKSGLIINYRIVNAYGPTLPRALENPQLITDFYQSLSSACNIPSRYELFIMGDFNSKLGKNSLDELMETNISDHVGRFAVGTRNSNGEHMLNFLMEHNLFACNTAFQHKCRHITTRTGWLKDHSRPNSNCTIPVYTQIDYIVCKTRSKAVLQDARSYAGAKLSSDHKIVMARLDFSTPYLIHKRKPSRTLYDISHLTCNMSTQRAYQDSLNTKLGMSSTNSSDDPSLKLQSLLDTVRSTAVEIVGFRRPQHRAHFSNDVTVVELVEKRKRLRLQLNTNTSEDRASLRHLINCTQKSIQKRLQEIRAQAADNLANTIALTDEARRMFEAVRVLNNSKPTRPITVHNEDGHVIASDTDKADAIRSWFESQFTGNEPSLDPFSGTPRPLNTPISTEEVCSALRKLKNNRACGPDYIPNELLKYAGPLFSTHFASIINECFETHTYIDAIGESILTPLQKPGKPAGPPKNLRPLNLLNGIRKVLSIISLNRIQDLVNHYTGPWQCGYKNGRSCADIVWSQRMLISVVLRKHHEFHKMGIDMSSAFDTIKRSTILRLLEDAGCSEDDIRLVRLLMANTKIKVRVNNATSVEFISTNGAFQGDSLSGTLFTLSLAGALYHVRAVVIERPNPPISDTGMPVEWEYSDDVDFAYVEQEPLQDLLPKCTEILCEWNLHVNEAKTEFVHFYLAGRGELDDDGIPLSDNESWRVCKSLGSLLCSTADITRRITLAHAAFQTYSKLWLQGPKIPLKRKLLVYDAQVVSVLLYNCSSWSAPKTVMTKLDTCHRKHLRRICNIYWPTGVISNRELYRRCGVIPITERVRKARWTLFGHILRMDDNSPASLALRYAVTSSDFLKGRRGRPRSNLFSFLVKDLKEHSLQLRNCDDLLNIKILASDRVVWRNMLIFRDEFNY